MTYMYGKDKVNLKENIWVGIKFGGCQIETKTQLNRQKSVK